MASALRSVQRVEVPEQVVLETLRTMQQFGQLGCEALVLWLGHVEGRDARVARAFAPPQTPIRGEGGVGYFVTSETLFQVNRMLAEHRLRLIAQVHSHPGAAYHSSADDRFAIVTEEGGLSLVVPDFGRAPAEPSQWATYRLTGGRWRSVPPAAARHMLSTDRSHAY